MSHRHDPRRYAPSPSDERTPRQSAHNREDFPREGSFAKESGFGHVPGQRWGGGYGGDAAYPDGPPSGRGFTGSDFGPARDPRHDSPVHNAHGTDMGMGERLDPGPHFGKGPKGYKRSDARIHEDVCDAIAQQGHIDATSVEVKVVSGIVTLRGTVHERHDKRGLEQLVEHVRGVEDVHNEVRLARSGAATERSGAGTGRGGEGNPRSGAENDRSEATREHSDERPTEAKDARSLRS